MQQEYTKDFFWSVYQKLPEDLKEAVFSEKNNEVVNNICINYGLDEEQASLVAKYTGRVLMGLLSLKDFSVTLELELNIDEKTANNMNKDLYLSVFKHYMVSLDKLNDIKMKDLFHDESIKNTEPVINKTPEVKKEPEIIIKKEENKKTEDSPLPPPPVPKTTSPSSDPYRESIE